ncbi:thiamine pyrophosphate enzyme, N-terminal TPP binding domain-containing protein [Elsinoe ampelina]|uniref:Thiamine pyrophosphate enzyme, N-terminal TPP binding domain-containing protein n=1 Tax=Elsinoe ampelina TaxID=302913 RepID=A0A6A6GRL6_9PEZI|nr:thiamine pyrophosphate enzyme, N-terminal TPP binding domain-containing protein [Elsinoe ampelina]
MSLRTAPSFAFFEAIWEAGVTHCFVNLGSDHPSIIEAMVKGQNEKKGQFPRIITCPNEMVALSLADGFARLTSRPQAVIIHVDVGTQGLGAAVHNASTGRAPVLIFAGLSPVTIEGEYRGSRTEYIHWIQDVPDQKAIVAQYCRYSGEIKRGRNVKQMVNRALSFAKSAPQGPVYLVGARESMEEDVEPYHLKMENWTAVEGAALTAGQAKRVADLLVGAEEPLVITGYSGRNHKAPGVLRELADTVRGLRVLDTGGSDMCFPADHPGWLGLRYGVEDAVRTADVILVLDCDVPWIPTQCKPREDARVVHIDVDPLKQQMPVFYIDAQMRFRADAKTSVRQIVDAVKNDKELSEKVRGKEFDDRWEKLQKSYQGRLQTIKDLAVPAKDGSFSTSYLASRLKALLPQDTIYAVEAVTNAGFVSDQLQQTIPGSWINCGGGGLGWSGGGALGIKLATDFEAGGKNKGKFVCQIVGDGTYLFSVPGSVYWIAQKYEIPVLTIVLNNKGWNAPRKSLLLVHPDGQGSKATNEELNISFAPTPDYAGIAAAASGHKAWAGQAWTADDLDQKLKDAIKAVQETGVCAVLDAHLEGPEGKFGGGKAVLVG